MLMTPIQILDLKIPEKVIFIIFIILAGIALFLYIFNLIFKKSRNRSDVKFSTAELEKQHKFDTEMDNVDSEINLILQVNKNPDQVVEGD
ncbi:hypothetical protein LD118_00566 [Mesoplasma lactucae ATCC 49193]|nr:TIGR04561 family membrane protein [Mesoplasma lactucae]ATZ20220.1 hypothetical protein MLACT_v1c03990 [Mesoplasma lactucae ATCC 49193]MCL8216969.1 hypothetical protein [Mesoplasma lactucae ATCC 49193]